MNATVRRNHGEEDDATKRSLDAPEPVGAIPKRKKVVRTVRQTGITKTADGGSRPSMFVKAVSGLTDAKKRVVREMGLGSLLDLRVTIAPSKMGFWLVNNFNHMDRKLQLYDGEKVHIKEDDVFAVFGLPRGAIELTNKKKRATSTLLDDWIRLLDVRATSNITASKVLDRMNECAEGDDWFKIHFIVLMVTCLFESCLNGMANFRLVHALGDLSKVDNMNWCSYMIRCLVDTKRSWDSNRNQKNYSGPLLFLTLFYVDKVVLSVRSVPRMFPTFKSWSNETLRARERDEISSGAFGRGFVDVDLCLIADSRHLDKVGPKASGDGAGGAECQDVQTYVQEFASETLLLATTGADILKLVEKAPRVLLGDDNFLKMRDTSQKLLGLYSEVPQGHTARHGTSQQRCTQSKNNDRADDNNGGDPYQTADDAFWNAPETLVAIDEIIRADKQRDKERARFKRMQEEGPVIVWDCHQMTMLLVAPASL
ncbi:Unknown protein [Striga hermonthica]|uniref:Aminotransferase-like plant mobile domain-containing protein n=1 Tax=Striga hermonthica TaxID=68872 RepID=A0A9N7NFB9_STRHE|nr:Unknown protein [Striga hermonthica]